MGEVVERLREGSLLGQAGARSRLVEVVSEALGPALSAHVSVGGVKAGKLVVFVDEPAYRFELQNYWYSGLLRAVQGQAPEARVGELQFELDPKAGSGAGRGRV